MLFTVSVIFRRPDAHSQHVVLSDPKGTITIDTQMCHLEGILSYYNVDFYRVDWCEHQVQIMKDFKEIPRFYYGEKDFNMRRAGT